MKKIIMLKINEETHKKFKIKVAEDNSNMNEKITKFIERYLNEK